MTKNFRNKHFCLWNYCIRCLHEDINDEKALFFFCERSIMDLCKEKSTNDLNHHSKEGQQTVI